MTHIACRLTAKNRDQPTLANRLWATFTFFTFGAVGRRVSAVTNAAEPAEIGERAFSHAGPATWDALPDHMRTVDDPANFRKLLKSHYFSQRFNIR